MQIILNFLNSQFFTGLVTLIAGATALVVFYRQKSDEKMKAARLVLNELRDAESKIDIISEKLNSQSTNDLPSVLPTNNWRSYSHLFVTDLDTDEFRLINEFYTACEIVHDAAMRNNNFFWITTEERARVVQQMLKDPGVAQEALEAVANHTYQYSPRKTLDLMEYHLRRINKITVAPCGEKLKKIARVV